MEEEGEEEEEDVNAESQFPPRLEARGGEGTGGEMKAAAGFSRSATVVAKP